MMPNTERGDRPLTPLWDGLGEQFESGGREKHRWGKRRPLNAIFFKILAHEYSFLYRNSREKLINYP